MGIIFGIILFIIILGLGIGAGVLFYNEKKKGGIILSILTGIFLIAFIFIPFSFHQINTGEIAVVKVWGKAEYYKTSGTYFDFWVGKSYQRYDTKIRQTQIETTAYSQDAQSMSLKITIQYKIQQDNVLEINNEYGSLEVLESRIEAVVEDNIKAIMSGRQAMVIIEERSLISAESLEAVKNATSSYYIDIDNILYQDIEFSEAFEQAVEDKMISEQQQLQAEYEAKKAEIEAQGKLAVAKLEAEAELAKAEKEAEATEVKAQAEANALKIIQTAWNEIDEATREVLLKQMAIESWNGELPDTLVGTEFLEWLLGAIQTTTTP